MVAAGEEIEALMTLCRADITTKNPNRVKRYLKNFDLVEEKMKTVMDKDSAKKFPDLKVKAVCADFAQTEILKKLIDNDKSKIGFFQACFSLLYLIF